MTRLGEPIPMDDSAAGSLAVPGGTPRTTSWDVDRLPSIRIGEVRVHALPEHGCIDVILRQIERGRGGWVITLNLHSVRLAARDAGYAALCRKATLAVADGMPLIWVSRLQGEALPERVTGSDLLSTLTAAASARGRSVLLLGGDPGTAEAAAAILQRRNPTVRVAGTLCPPMGFEQSPEQIAALVAATVTAHPDIVFVGLSTPKQDWLIGRLRAALPATWFVGVGNGFSFLCGAVPRAPRWMQRCGLEWLHRLAHEPRRLAKRYLLECLPFGVALIGNTVRRRVRGVRTGHTRAA